MRKKRGKKNMAIAIPHIVRTELSKKKRTPIRRTNKMAEMTKEDLKEWNVVSKRNRGLSQINMNDIFGDGK
ncbi:hypothetical protein [Brevibacillus sp. AY1]|uniref:hypothetical protein n=1 Tax=Brevibacillus sp. AY1 TaxID=2807621 RepID=UPI0024549FF8|nr:hypothetical protein [Brevibacillus sp. AY1]MDH4620179.1 hypothetical protein [Brevibacillus sp. AY1]